MHTERIWSQEKFSKLHESYTKEGDCFHDVTAILKIHMTLPIMSLEAKINFFSLLMVIIIM